MVYGQNGTCMDKMVYGQNGTCMDKMVYGQNGTCMDKMVYGQNGTCMDKMVYGQNGIGQNDMDKMARTKLYGSNITNKVINQSSFHLQYNCFINPASTLTPSVFFYGLVIYL